MPSGDLCQRQDLCTAFDCFFCVGVIGMFYLGFTYHKRLTPVSSAREPPSLLAPA